LIRRILSLVFVIILVVGVGAATYFLSIQTSNYPEALAEFTVQNGQATITSNGNETVVTPEDRTPARIGAGGTIKTEGESLLTFVGAQLELTAGTEMILRRYLSRDNEAQIDLELVKGQVVQHINGYSNPRSIYSLHAGNSTLFTRGGDFITHRSREGVGWHVSALGVADVTANSQSVHLQTNMGTYLRPKEPPTIPTLWGQVNVPTFKPDGTAIELPVQMVNQKTSEQFDYVSNKTFLVPAGTYRLQITTLVTYTIDDITITANTFQEFPVTFSEVVFNVVNQSDVSLTYTALTLKGDLETRAVPNTPVLVPPGKTRIIAAREENPELLQPIDLDILPGQQILLPVRDDLFGGGTIQVKLGTIDDEAVDPIEIDVYLADKEDGPPVDTFKSDATSMLLPPGNYVVIVNAQIAGRYEISVKENEQAVLDAPLGYLDVDYLDEQGEPITKRSIFIYIASMGEMRRLGLSIEQMRSTRFGKALSAANTDKLLVPAATYNILVDDLVNVSKDSVEVPSGRTVVVALEVQAQ
jgi:hypothetical protein